MSYAKIRSSWTDNVGQAVDASVMTTLEQGIFDATTKTDTNATPSGTSYTLVLADAGNIVEHTNSGASTITIPPNSSVAFVIGTVIEVHVLGAGQVTLTPGSGVTLRSRGGALKSAGQYAVMSMRKRATDEWMVTGDVST